MLQDRPLCKCHGEPMVKSGHWRCSVKRRASQREAQRKFRQTISGHVVRRRFDLLKAREQVLEQLTKLRRRPL